MMIIRNPFIFSFFCFLLILLGCEDNAVVSELEIAFAAKNDGVSNIYTMNLEKNQVVHITTGYTPKYVPHSNEMVFESGYDILVFNRNNDEIINLTNSTFYELDPSVSSDGSTIIYSSSRDEQNNDHRTEIYSMNLNSSQIERLTHSQSWATEARLSPNSTYLSYFTWDSLGRYYSLMVLDLTTNVNDTISKHCRTSTFSPDESLICYTVVNVGLTITNLITHETYTLVNEGFYPMFSPNGDVIYYMTDNNDELVIAKINSDGSGKTYFQTGQIVYRQFDISPNGEVLVFVKLRDDSTSWISTINTDGTNLKELTPGYTPVFKP